MSGAQSPRGPRARLVHGIVIRQQRSNNGVAFGLGIAVAGPKHAKTLLYPPVHPKNPKIKNIAMDVQSDVHPPNSSIHRGEV